MVAVSRYLGTSQCMLISGLMLCLLACIAFFINYAFFHFLGNNYIPHDAFRAGICLLVILVSVKIYFAHSHYLCDLVQSLFLLYLTMGAIALLTNAVQFTPFNPIDSYLVRFEHACHVDMAAIIAWTSKHSWLKKILEQIYATLPYQMSIIPITLAICGQFSRLQGYFCLMLVSSIIGFSFYYFFPTTAPASIIQSPFFSQAQYATGIKFVEIHKHLTPSTIEGGMIALPSFHVIWAWLCLYLVRCWPVIFIFLLPINLLLILSCVLLGWHYPTDLLGSLIVLLITHAIHTNLTIR